MSTSRIVPDFSPPVAISGPLPQRRHLSHPLNRETWAGLGLLAAYAVVGVSAVFVFGSHLTTLPRDSAWISILSNAPGPSWSHPFGVLTGLGTDLFTAIWQATPWDLAIVFGILAIDSGTAIFLGAIAGMWAGGWADRGVTFFSDATGAIPPVLLVTIALIGLSELSLVNLGVFVVAFGLLLWPPAARGVRERARIVARAPYVDSSRASGAGDSRVLVHHVVPASLGPVFAQLPTDIAAIFTVLSVFTWFHNCVQPPVLPAGIPLPHLPPGVSPLPSVNFPEWGNLLGIGVCWGFTTQIGPIHWWMWTFPLLAIVGLGIALALFCDGMDKWFRFRA